MRRLPWVLLALGVTYVASHIAAHVLGQTPIVFFTETLPGWVGAGLVLVGIGVVIMQLSRR